MKLKKLNENCRKSIAFEISKALTGGRTQMKKKNGLKKAFVSAYNSSQSAAGAGSDAVLLRGIPFDIFHHVPIHLELSV